VNVPERNIHVLQELTRLRTTMVQNRTDYKNRVHKVLQRCNIRLGSKLHSVFGKAGMEVLNGLMTGKSLDEIVNESNSRLLKERRGELEKVVRAGLDQEDVFVLKRCLRMVESLDGELKELDARIAMLVADREKEVKNISKVPGVAQVSASAILAEIGDAKRFADGKKITSWTGYAHPSTRKKAYVSLARKILCIIHHLLVTGEE